MEFVPRDGDYIVPSILNEVMNIVHNFEELL
jgi:hypothetical protein